MRHKRLLWGDLMDPAFERALQKIPAQLRERPGARFTVIIRNQKKPEGTDWSGPNGANYGINDAPLAGYLSQGHNYGVLCGHAGINVVDIDDPVALVELGIMQKIPDTMQVKTGRDGEHVYFDCPELDHQIGLYHPILMDADGEPLHLGEIQSSGQQVVGANSIHPNGNRYELVNDVPIATLSKADLLAIFDGLILTGGEDPQEEPRKAEHRRRSSGGASLGDLIHIDAVAWPKAVKERRGSEITGSHPLHGSDSGKNFSINTAKNCWHCFRHKSGGGPLEWIAVNEGLISCQDAKPGCLDDKELFKKVLQIARDRGFDIPEPERSKAKTPPGPTLEDALLFIAGRCDGAHTTDGQGFNKLDTTFGKAMADKVRTGKRLSRQEYKDVYKMLKNYNNKQLIPADMDLRLIPKEQQAIEEEESSTPEVPQFGPDILAEANQILDEGRGFEFVHGVWQKRHHGDENLGRGLFLSIGSQSCEASKGVHIHACGPRGSGKSDGAEKASEAIPAPYLLVGSASPKALYYLGERLPPGAVVYLDDIGWNDQAAQMFKTCTTFYREGATHTVVLDGEIKRFKTAPRIGFWLTTADDQTDEQIRDRLLRIDTTETSEHTKAVIDFIFQQRKSGAAAFDSREPEISRAIIYLLKQVLLDVVIPYADKIRFAGSPRGATIFADLISAFAIWRHRIRARDSTGAIIACYEDYKDAETFFNSINGHGDSKFTPRELRVLQAVRDLHGVATREMVMEKTGFSKGGLSDILNGRSRDGQAKYGLFHKCAALTEDTVATTTPIDADSGLRTSIKKRTLRLSPDYNLLAAYSKSVYLDDETTIERTCSSGSPRFAGSSQTTTDTGEPQVRKFVLNKDIRENETTEPSLVVNLVDSNCGSSQAGPKPDELANSGPHGSDLPPRTSHEPLRTMTNSPANKARLWGSIGSKLKKTGRKDGKRRGLAVTDLQADEVELIEAAGWQQETTETGISILWADEKSIRALGLEAGQ
jgi:hypothetical protein